MSVLVSTLGSLLLLHPLDRCPCPSPLSVAPVHLSGNPGVYTWCRLTVVSRWCCCWCCRWWLLLLAQTAWPADDRQEKVLFSLLLNLMRIRDDRQPDRIRLAFEDRSFGLLPVISSALHEVGAPLWMRCAAHGWTYFCSHVWRNIFVFYTCHRELLVLYCACALLFRFLLSNAPRSIFLNLALQVPSVLFLCRVSAIVYFCFGGEDDARHSACKASSCSYLVRHMSHANVRYGNFFDRSYRAGLESWRRMCHRVGKSAN